MYDAPPRCDQEHGGLEEHFGKSGLIKESPGVYLILAEQKHPEFREAVFPGVVGRKFTVQQRPLMRATCMAQPHGPVSASKSTTAENVAALSDLPSLLDIEQRSRAAQPSRCCSKSD